LPKLTLILILLFSLLGCGEKQVRDTGVYYVIKHEDTSAKVMEIHNDSMTEKENKISPLSNIAPSYTTIYGDHNFILHGNDSVFYFAFTPPETGCLFDGEFARKPILRLTQDSLHVISIRDLQKFLDSTIIDSVKLLPGTWTLRRHVVTSISSLSDTIRNPAFTIITSHLVHKNISSNNINIRNWTFEEQAVVTAKMQNLGYDPDTLGNDGDFSVMLRRQRE
jgi:hypothetical protein